MSTIMAVPTIIQYLKWFGVLGFPSMVAIFVYVVRYISAFRLGIQALLRSQMVSDYNKWTKKGYAPIYIRESFEDCYKEYHVLGGNGFISDIHKKFMELPTSKDTAKT